METYNAEARSHVESRSDGDVRVVVMAGEFDIDNVADLRIALDPAASGVTRFVLDVAAVTFVDSAALGIMLQPALDRPVVLAGAVPRRLARLLELTGADMVFATAPSVAEGTVMVVPPRQG
ncbi:STAS domain-containing protein [Streptomyces erythrochromogenes]|uniref:STAS domain-containing protein n=1 Tax=Streptomyces erythrochromogenes TaxID=285574 RepID=UPI0036F9D999|nr:STAS domain-containing protein [Streptomyces erythrochromogenes]WST99010.1 STAS domain-containing protein [Streptomyces erythrochromogenes]